MYFWYFSHSGEIFVYLFICSLWFSIQVLKCEAFITFYDKTPGVAPEGQSTLRASTLQGCGPDTETRMNDMSTSRLLWKDVHFTTSPEVRTFQEALLLSPGNSQINGDLMVRQSQVTSSHCFHGEPFCWPFVAFGAGGSSEVARWWSVTASGILREQPCVHVSMCPSADGSRFEAARAKWYRWDVSKQVFNLCVWFVFQVAWKLILVWCLLKLFIHHMLFIDNLIPDMLTDLNPFEAFIDSFHCRSQAAGGCT